MIKNLMKEQIMKVLLVEDNVEYASYLQEILIRSTTIPLEITKAYCLQKAIHYISEESFNIVLLDLSLPDSSGIDTFLQLHRLAKSLPIIILTGYDDEELSLKAVQAGAQDYLSKSHMDGPLLLRAIRYAIERNRSAEAFRQSEKRFRKIIKHNADGIMLIDKKGIIRLINQAAEHLFDKSADSMIGQDIGIPLVADDKVQIEILTKMGHVNIVELSAVEITWSGERVYLASMRDITDHIHTEAELRSSEERFRRVIASISDHIYVGEVIHGEHFKTLYLSPHVEPLTGYLHETLMNDYQFWATRIIHPDDQGLAKQQLKQLVHGGHSEVEYRLVKADKTIVWVRDSARAEVADNDCVTIYGVVSEITERKELEEQLSQAQKMEALGQLAGGVAHDFNNLLTVIIGYSKLLATSLGEDFSKYDFIQEITDSAERAASLTRQLLAFSRKQVMEVQPIDLNHIVSNVEKMLRRLIGEDIDFVVDLTPGLGIINADPGQIEQVIMNLIVNARDAMPSGGQLLIRTKNVHVTAGMIPDQPDIIPGRYVVLEVEDTGIGMDEVTASRIFDPFFTTKEMGKGTGLGLSTVHGVIKQSQGHIAVKSTINQGTLFTLYFMSALTKGPAHSPEIAEIGATLTGAETILLVEDEQTVRDLAHKILRGYGYSTLKASHGQEAFEICQEYQGDIDLLITDIIMPGGMNGHQLAKLIVEKRPDIKVLFMSGYTKNTRLDLGNELTSNIFLPKPFTPMVLANKVRQVLGASSI
ncbi:MAG: response regulator [Chloroflexota bacterium]